MSVTKLTRSDLVKTAERLTSGTPVMTPISVKPLGTGDVTT
jgi:hypothetical protein